MAELQLPVREKKRARRNRTLEVLPAEVSALRQDLQQLRADASPDRIANRLFCQDLHQALPYLPKASVDLLFLDPPYNLRKDFNGQVFRNRKTADYIAYLESWLPRFLPLLKPNATVYICGDWRSSSAIQQVAEQYFHIQNRITWEREKGRGAKTNWKNCTEDIWFCTVGKSYTFNVNDVKLKRRVLAPYRKNGQPKDWQPTEKGNFRLTHPSNVWTDITVPFWSMPENTDHPTQKPEKLLAKLLLASTDPDALVLDPFAGSGTTGVVAKKLNRRYCLIEREELYCLWAAKRLRRATTDTSIQGYEEGVFWERNAAPGKA